MISHSALRIHRSAHIAVLGVAVRLVAAVAAWAAACTRVVAVPPSSSVVPVSTADASATALEWHSGQGRFVTAACFIGHRLWVGSDDNGLWGIDTDIPNSQWLHVASEDGLAEDSITALAADRLGRLWVGHPTQGLSVLSGKQWRRYSVNNGPLGVHVMAIAASPIDGDVWVASNVGLARYSLSQNTWSYFTRMHGLPSDQPDSIAFSPDGSIYVGLECDGLAIASPRDDYHSWTCISAEGRRVTGVVSPVDAPKASQPGTLLPSNLVNSVLVTRDGAYVFVGTTTGLAISADRGNTWARWTAGPESRPPDSGTPSIPSSDGRPGKPGGGSGPADGLSVPDGRITDDFVSALLERAGRIWVGYRRGGVDTITPATWARERMSDDLFVTGFLSLPDAVGITMYGGGVRFLRSKTIGVEDSPVLRTGHGTPVPHPPRVAPALSAADFARLGSTVALARRPFAPGDAGYLGDDWSTLGDWCGYYGTSAAVLCAARSPVDHALITDPRYRIAGSIGPNHQQGDSMRHWVHWLSTNQRRVLYDPIAHTRRQAEWDDHGENYDNHTDGPDLWIAVEVPAGIHRLSLYFVNKDGHEGPNPYRDYLIELKPFGPSPAEAARLPTMARARVRFFWSGVYKQFIVGGPAKYCVRIARNGNHNTILSGVFFDKLRGPWSPVDVRPMPWLGGVRPGPAELLSDGSTSGSRTGARQKADPSTPALAQARVLWGLARAAVCWSDGFIYERPLCLLAYRSAAVTGIPRSLQRDWRWQLRILFDEDRDAFDKEMALSYDRWAAQHPDLASKHY